MKDTIVISAFPCCGKTTAMKEYSDKYSMMDIDSSNFSWCSNFPENYITYIKEFIGEYDFIFVSTHLEVRKLLTENKMPYVTVYPSSSCMTQWVGRMWLRKDDDKYIQDQVNHWHERVDEDVVYREPHGFMTIRLYDDEYIDEELLDGLYRKRNLIKENTNENL